jgi:hypothetical protein
MEERSKKVNAKKLAPLVIALLIVTSYTGVAYADSFAPTWLKEGVYAEYSGFRHGNIVVPNNTDPSNPEWRGFVNGTFRWECLELNETTAKLRSTLTVTETEFNTHPLPENKTVQYKSEFFVDTRTRAVYLLNGTIVGTTCLWVPPNPSTNEEILMWDVPPDKVAIQSRVFDVAPNVRTPQGLQRAFDVQGQGKIGGSTVTFSASFDFDTGVLCFGRMTYEPAITSVFGFEEFNYGGSMQFVDTNIDLGPGGESFDLQVAGILIALIVAIVIIFVAVYKRKRARH